MRQAIEAAYAKIAAAMASRDFEALRGTCAPDFAEISATGAERDVAAMIAALKPNLADAEDIRCRFDIDSIVADGDDAAVVATVKLAYRGELGWQKFRVREEETRHDAWVLIEGDWRLRRSAVQTSRMWGDDQLVSERCVARPLSPTERAAVVGDVRAQAHPFVSVSPGTGLEDLACLDRVIGDARLVALGEASHGTAECFRMKHRILEYLVTKKGFTVFAIEGNWPEALAADRYVETGEGSAAAGLAAMYFWTWQTEEIAAMVDWMRAYNATRGDRPALSFSGFDMQFTKAALQHVLDFIDRCGVVALAQELRSLYGGAETLDDGPSALETAKILELRDSAMRAIERIEAARGALVAASTAAAYRDALQAARIVAQACEARTGVGFAVRDRAMADNAAWLLEERFQAEKIVVWAHNGHVQRGGNRGWKSQGMHLADRYGSDMVVLGFAFHHGEVRSNLLEHGRFQPGGPRALPLAPARPASVEAVFDEAGMPRFILDLRSMPANGALSRWLAGPQPHRTVGSGYDPQESVDPYQNVVLPDLYDGIIFIAESTAAKPLS